MINNFIMVDIWKKYNSSKSYDEYFNLDNKLRKQAKTISGILERYGIKKLNEIEKNCQSTINARGINFKVYSADKRQDEKKWPLDIIPRIIEKKNGIKFQRDYYKESKRSIFL